MKTIPLDEMRFLDGLEQDDRDLLRAAAKSDLHSHSGLGYRLEVLERWSEKRIQAPPVKMLSLSEMNAWILAELQELYSDRACFEFAIRAALAEAWNDGITLLEMSVDVAFLSHYNNDAERFGQYIHEAHRVVAPEINFRAEIGVAREMDPKESLPLALSCVESGHFSSIDLYGTEDARDPLVYKDLYKAARKQGLKCKAHVGEFGDAATLLHTAQVLELNAIQHGIAAAGSQEVVSWLAKERVTLNICPTSNVRLSRVQSMPTHPIRMLFDAGVSVTVNSDDIMVFNQNVSDEFLNLYKAGLFSAEELNTIRLNGLAQ
jgi:adenosine deaminase